MRPVASSRTCSLFSTTLCRTRSPSLSQASASFEYLVERAREEPCGGISWLWPDADPRKNAVTTLQAIQAASQLASLQATTHPALATRHSALAERLWLWFIDAGLLNQSVHLVHDHVSGEVKKKKWQFWGGLRVHLVHDHVSGDVKKRQFGGGGLKTAVLGSDPHNLDNF